MLAIKWNLCRAYGGIVRIVNGLCIPTQGKSECASVTLTEFNPFENGGPRGFSAEQKRKISFLSGLRSICRQRHDIDRFLDEWLLGDVQQRWSNIDPRLCDLASSKSERTRDHAI